MGSLKSKYKRNQSELIEKLLESGRTTAVLEVKVLGTSKIKETFNLRVCLLTW